MRHSLRPVISADDWHHLHAIRRAVLFAPGRHGVDYDENHPDDRAGNNIPLLLLLDNRPIGVVRLDLRGDVGVVRLVAIVKAEQRRGHGRALDRLIDAEARRQGVGTLRVNAAPDAVGFYEKCGWRREDWDPSELAGLSAHAVQLAKRL